MTVAAAAAASFISLIIVHSQSVSMKVNESRFKVLLIIEGTEVIRQFHHLILYVTEVTFDRNIYSISAYHTLSSIFLS